MKYTKHAKTKHPLYRVWVDMKDRCTRQKNTDYKYYGERGVTVCKEWFNDFEEFYRFAVIKGWAKGLTIDRIDPNSNYCPQNCRFVDRKTQSLNRRPFGKIKIKYIDLCFGKYRIRKLIGGKIVNGGMFETLKEAKDRIKELEAKN